MAVALGDIIATLVTDDQEANGGWNPSVHCYQIQRAAQALPGSDPVNRARRTHRSMAAFLEQHRPSLAPIVASMDGTVLKLCRPGEGWRTACSQKSCDRLRNMFRRIDAEQTEARLRVLRHGLARERRAGPKVWSPANHHLFGPRFRAIIQLLLLARASDGQHSEQQQQQQQQREEERDGGAASGGGGGSSEGSSPAARTATFRDVDVGVLCHVFSFL